MAYPALQSPARIAPAPLSSAERIPICVDLDGTLIFTDLLWECIVRFVRNRPWQFYCLFVWAFQGRDILKRRLAERVEVDPGTLPYNEPLLEWLRAESNAGATLVLATASDEILAESIAQSLGIFDRVIGSSPGLNCKGAIKLRILEREFPQGFDYAGNSRSDQPLWDKCREAVIVNAGRRTLQNAARDRLITRVFPNTKRRIPAIWHALRPHHWVKNLLVIVPVVTSHRLGDLTAVWSAMLAIFCFSCTASAVYVCNDLLDMDSDRRHKLKSRRPFANGDLPIWTGLLLSIGLLAIAGVCARRLPVPLSLLLAAYFVASSFYSLYLKRVALLDVFMLAGFYTMRLLAGHFAASVAFSQWLLSFGMLTFLSLALDKRISELFNLKVASSDSQAHGRGYVAGDLESLSIMSVGSGFGAMLVLSFYIDSAKVRTLYEQPLVLWALFPLLLYWITRLAFLARRGEVHEDPLVFVAKDRVTYVIAFITALILICGTFGLGPNWATSQW
jgi:4-hydroxybenzoate polyprenyltransferase